MTDQDRPSTEPDPFLAALMRQRPGVDLADTVADLLASMRPEWHRRAACRGVGPAVFFVERGGSTAPAKDLCQRCEVTAQCQAAGQLEDHGMWAGESPKARRLVRSSGHLRPPAA
jgi:hypothetical protein